VRLSLSPRESGFYPLFCESADNLAAGISLLADLLAADADSRPDVAAKIVDAEHRGDEVTHQILRLLNSTFVTPFDREDIYRLAGRLDDVMDFVEAAADHLTLYALDDLPHEIDDQLDVLRQSAEQTVEAMRRLKTMRVMEEYWIEVNRLENAADRTYRRLVAKLFSGQYDALTVMKLKEVVDELENAADAFEHIADTVETIVVKES
jgi:predicted phosphate transport protein (TIGR00153 family)